MTVDIPVLGVFKSSLIRSAVVVIWPYYLSGRQQLKCHCEIRLAAPYPPQHVPLASFQKLGKTEPGATWTVEHQENMASWSKVINGMISQESSRLIINTHLL